MQVKAGGVPVGQRPRGPAFEKSPFEGLAPAGPFVAKVDTNLKWRERRDPNWSIDIHTKRETFDTYAERLNRRHRRKRIWAPV
jgi:hypothetical protein